MISGTKITMEAPKLSGFTRDQRWYELTAKAAAQDITKPDVVELQEIRAKIEMQDKSTINLSATDGLLRPQDRHAHARPQTILLTSSSGYEMQLERSHGRHRQRQCRVRTSRSR